MLRVTIALVFCVSSLAASLGNRCQASDKWTGLSLSGGAGGSISHQTIDRYWAFAHGLESNTYVYGWLTQSTDHGTMESSVAAFATAQVGYDLPLTSWLILGAFADVDIFQGSDRFQVNAGWWESEFRGTINYDYSFSTGARLGAIVTENILVYGLVGYTFSDANIRCVECGPSIAPSSKFDLARSGLLLGGGVEQWLGASWSLRFEYRYAQFDDEGFLSLYRGDSNYWSEEEATIEGQQTHSLRASIVWRN